MIQLEYHKKEDRKKAEALLQESAERVENQERVRTITLSFPIPEEEETAVFALKATDMFCAIWEFDQQYLRNKLKYEDLSEEAYEALEAARERLWEILSDNDLSDIF